MPPRWRQWRRHAAFLLWQAPYWLRSPRTRRGLMKRLMHTPTANGNGRHPAPQAIDQPSDVNASAIPAPEGQSGQQDGALPKRRILLVRHGQSTYNVENRLPGQLPGIPLTDLGRRQAQRAAVALSGLPLGAVVSSPLERARETAALIARGWGLEVRLDDRLMDTNVGRWSGQVLAEIEKNDPAWKEFVAHPSQPPEGVEGFNEVAARVVAALEDVRRDPTLGEYVVVVAHADVVKLIVAHYIGVQVDRAPFLHVDNASITALGFEGPRPPVLLALNWTPLPGWLTPWKAPDAQAAQPVPAGMDHAAGAAEAGQPAQSAAQTEHTEEDRPAHASEPI